MTTKSTKKPKVYVGKHGGVRVDAKEFFAQSDIQERRKAMAKMNIVGLKLDMRNIKNPQETSKK